MIRIIYTLLVILLISSCQNEAEIKTKNDDSSSMILLDFEKQSEIFTISPHSFFKVIGKEGTEISIDTESLVHQDGTLPTSIITIELKEYYSASDIILNNLTTQTNSDLLETGGMIFLQAKSDNKLLKVREGQSIKIKFPSKGIMKKGMQLFKGKKDGNYIVWDDIPITDTAETVVPEFDRIYSEFDTADIFQWELDFYLFNSRELGWLNCDKILEGVNKTVLALNVDTEVVPNVRIMFLNLRLAAFGKLENSKLNFYNIPIGEPATIIGFYKSEDKHYIYKNNITVSANMEVTAVFQEVSLEGLKTEIDAIKWRDPS